MVEGGVMIHGRDQLAIIDEHIATAQNGVESISRRLEDNSRHLTEIRNQTAEEFRRLRRRGRIPGHLRRRRWRRHRRRRFSDRGRILMARKEGETSVRGKIISTAKTKPARD
jgi:hypothetical protein